MWRPFVKSLKELAAFGRARGGFEGALKARRQIKRQWSLLGIKDSDASLLQELASSGRRLEEVTTHPAWTDILAAKQFYQYLSDWKTKTQSLTEAQRFQAAVEWATLEGFFKELSSRIRRGKEAEQKLSKVTAKVF